MLKAFNRFFRLAIVLALVAVLSSISIPAVAGEVDDNFRKGSAASKAGDHRRAFLHWELSASAGHERAQFNIGYMYAKGQGVKRDDAEAARWFRKAANQGLASAQFIMGMLYRDGRGVSRDYAEARRWLRLSAEQGDIEARRELKKLGK